MFYPCHAYEYLSLALLHNYGLSINLIRLLKFSNACFLLPMLSAFLFFRFNFFFRYLFLCSLRFFLSVLLSFVIIELLDIHRLIASWSIVTAIKLPQFLSFSSSKSCMIIYTGRFKTGSILWKLSLNVGNKFTYQ